MVDRVLVWFLIPLLIMFSFSMFVLAGYIVLRERECAGYCEGRGYPMSHRSGSDDCYCIKPDETR